MNKSGNSQAAEKNALQKEQLDNRLLAYQKQLRRLASELSLIEARERREIASDLHDHIGQALAYVSQKVSTLKGNTIFSGMDEDFSEILSILDQTIRYTRDLTVEISPPVLYELGLPAAVEWLAERNEKRYKIKTKISQSGSPIDMSENVKVFMFKSVKELINNVVKHAKADRIEIKIEWKDEHIKIIVSDNGQGFEPSRFQSENSDKCCFGLFSIRERLSYIGGNLEIDSGLGKGSVITITAPCEISVEGHND